MDSRSTDTEKGIVTSVQDNNAIVELSIQDACASCGARMVCIPDNTGKRRLKADNPLNAQVGNRVSITEKSNFLLKISFLQYGIPFIGFITAIFSLYSLEISVILIPVELVYFCGGLMGLVLGALISRYIIGRIAEKGGSFFIISKIY